MDFKLPCLKCKKYPEFELPDPRPSSLYKNAKLFPGTGFSSVITLKSVSIPVDTISNCVEEPLTDFENVYTGTSAPTDVNLYCCVSTPLIALAYHPKTIDFMTQFEVEKYAIADTELTTEKYISCFNNLVEEANFIGNKIFNKSKLLSQEIQIDFDKLIKENLYR